MFADKLGMGVGVGLVKEREVSRKTLGQFSACVQGWVLMPLTEVEGDLCLDMFSFGCYEAPE